MNLNSEELKQNSFVKKKQQTKIKRSEIQIPNNTSRLKTLKYNLNKKKGLGQKHLIWD